MSTIQPTSAEQVPDPKHVLEKRHAKLQAKIATTKRKRDEAEELLPPKDKLAREAFAAFYDELNNNEKCAVDCGHTPRTLSQEQLQELEFYRDAYDASHSLQKLETLEEKIVDLKCDLYCVTTALKAAKDD